MHGRKVGHWRVAGNALGKLDRRCKAGVRLDDVVGKTEQSAFVSPVAAPGQHHIDDAGSADQPRQAHRSAAAEENAAAAFREGVVGRALGDPDMACSGELEAAAYDRAMKNRHHRRPAELYALESAMPGPRMRNPGRDVALCEFGEIEPGAEMLALAVDDDGFDVVGDGREEVLNALNGGVVQRVALVRATQAEDANRAVLLEVERGRKLIASFVIAVGHCK